MMLLVASYTQLSDLKGQVRPIETLVLLIVLIFKNTMLFTGT